MSPHDPPSWAAVGDVLDVILDLPAPERAAYLDRHVADPTLRREVESYLAYEDARDPVLDAPDVQRRALLAEALGEEGALRPGDRLGPYQIVSVLGTGGAGTVYAAFDTGADKAVALKVLPPLRPDAAERLRREGRALARMEHPHVARFMAVGGGKGEGGLAYLVMELVDGEPITDYADRHGLSVAERVRLLEQTCAAVQHAHERLVIHRDLKPSNVLVTEAAGRPDVKVVDFGIGHLLDDAVGLGGDSSTGLDPASTVYLRLTPAYAAPEQLRGDPVSVASDVYTLGVLAYELLTGRHPFVGDTASTVDRPAPPAPSTVGPVERVRALRGDLDAVVLRSMETDPAERYATADGLLADLVRFREHRPVTSRPPTTAYRSARFVRRHRVPLALGTSALALLATSAGYAATQARAAYREAASRGAVQEFVVAMLEQADPSERESEDVSVESFLGLTAAQASERLQDHPEALAGVLVVSGVSYRGLGRYDDARHLLNRALGLRRDLYGAEHPAVAEALCELAMVYDELGQDERADSLFVLAIGIQRRTLPALHEDLAACLNSLGNVREHLGRYDEAEALLREALGIFRRLPGDRRRDLALISNNLGVVFYKQERYADAERLYRQALRLRRAALGIHPETATSIGNLAVLYRATDRYEEAEALYREALAMDRRLLGPEHPAVARRLHNIAYLRKAEGDLDGAVAIFRQALAMRQRLLGEHPDVAQTWHDLASALLERGDFAEAARSFERAAALRTALFGPAHRSVLVSRASRATALGEMGEFALAETETRQVIEVKRASGATPADIARTQVTLAVLMTEQGRVEEAEPVAREALASLLSGGDDQAPYVASARSALGASLAGQGKFREAEGLLLTALTYFRDELGEGARKTDNTRERVHDLYEAWGRPAQAAQYRTGALQP